MLPAAHSTIHGSGLELGWLAELANDLALVAQPHSKFDRFVLPERLIEGGMTLIQEAEHSETMTKLAQAIQVRNALMVACSGFIPSDARTLPPWRLAAAW